MCRNIPSGGVLSAIAVIQLLLVIIKPQINPGMLCQIFTIKLVTLGRA